MARGRRRDITEDSDASEVARTARKIGNFEIGRADGEGDDDWAE